MAALVQVDCCFSFSFVFPLHRLFVVVLFCCGMLIQVPRSSYHGHWHPLNMFTWKIENNIFRNVAQKVSDLQKLEVVFLLFCRN